LHLYPIFYFEVVQFILNITMTCNTVSLYTNLYIEVSMEN
jgi:hypothetical protein